MFPSVIQHEAECGQPGENKQRSGFDLTEASRQKREVSEYEPPVIITYTSEEIAEQIGPAQACTGDPLPCSSPGV